MRQLGNASFGAITFCASQHGNEECGANGLPLTLNSTRVLGAFQLLTTLQHPNLASYLHLCKGKRERVFVVSEHYNKCLTDLGNSELNSTSVPLLLHQTLSALSYLNEKGISHSFITPQSILINHSGKVLLSNYGLHHMTEAGATVSFPIGHSRYSSPETIRWMLLTKKDLSGTSNKTCRGDDGGGSGSSGGGSGGGGLKGGVGEGWMEKGKWRSLGRHKADVWSVGLVFLEVLLGTDVWRGGSLKEVLRKLLDVRSDTHPMDSIVQSHQQETQGLVEGWGDDLVAVLRNCLQLRPSHRPSAEELLCRKVFSQLPSLALSTTATTATTATPATTATTAPPATTATTATPATQATTATPATSLTTIVTGFEQFIDVCKNDCKNESSPLLSQLPQQEVFYLWTLAGGDLEGCFKGRINTAPPIFGIPTYIRADGESFGTTFDRSTLFDTTPLTLPLEHVTFRLKNMTTCDFFPSLSPSENTAVPPLSKLSYSVREKDLHYQFHRVVRMRRLLAAYPWKRADLLAECTFDIPPLYRPYIWAAVLDVKGDLLRSYERIDKDTPSATDRQIEVDIPRCHQYNALLSSPTAHGKFKRLLKAWVTQHPHYVYWQGLDSLLAPFLYLHFNHEALAFACFCCFIDKYLQNFFCKDNSLIIQEYLAVFSHLICFHDPQLSTHMHNIGFIPDLYSIPWFLTMYAHAFPLDKIFPLWDCLLMGDTSFPLCIGVAILRQLRTQLLTYDFNECILLFSDLPGVDIEACVSHSLQVFSATPASCTHRKHSGYQASSSSSSHHSFNHYHSSSSPVTHLSMSDIPLEVLKAEMCPRISAEDLIELMALTNRNGFSQTSCKLIGCENKSVPSNSVLVVDVRERESFMTGCLPTSINAPYNSHNNQNDKSHCNNAINNNNNNNDDSSNNNNNNSGDIPSYLIKLLEGSMKHFLKVIVAEKHSTSDKKMAEALVRRGYERVCVLDGGVEVMQREGFLTSPSDAQLTASSCFS